MIHITDIYQLKSRLNKLRLELDNEHRSYQDKELAKKYLNKAIAYVDELRLY